MQVIKLGIISLIVFALFFTGLSLFFPSHIHVSKAIDIAAPKDSVMAQLNNPANWKKWYPGGDTSELVTANGKVIGIGTGNSKGLLITASTDSTVTAVNGGPNAKKGEAGWNIFAGNRPNTYTVQWYMNFHLHWYPWEKFSGLLLEKRYGPMMEQGLDNLKKLLER